MNRFIMYIDILGYDKLAKNLEEKTGIEEDDIREKFIKKPFIGRINALRYLYSANTKGLSELEGSDNYVLLFDDMINMFIFMNKISAIRIPIKYSRLRIPVEIAVDVIEINDESNLSLTSLGSYIAFMKNDIITPYKRYYKELHDESRITSFYTITERVYESLEIYDKNKCLIYEYNGNNGYIVSYELIKKISNMHEFLEQIGLKGSRIYDKIEDVFVPPIEYNEILEKLAEDRIVFITGIAEYGKTFTAIKILWSYYNEGYRPIWVKGSEENERSEVRKNLENIDKLLEKKNIIYFEDPFGLVKYEKRESLERYIGSVIEKIKHSNNAYVIITSREEVFKQFKEQNSTFYNMEEFEQKLNIKTPSYDYSKRIEMFEKWARIYNCSWMEKPNLVTNLYKNLADITKLPTPLSIRDFCVSTMAETNPTSLRQKIMEKSQETELSISKEFGNMEVDKIVFSMYPYISNFQASIVQDSYNRVVRTLGLDTYQEFEDILSWFLEDKVEVRNGAVIFSHPSYAESLKYLLSGSTKKIYFRIISCILSDLINNVDTSYQVALFMTKNFDLLYDDMEGVFLEISSKKETSWLIAYYVRKNYEIIDQKMRDNIVLILSTKIKESEMISKKVVENYNTISDELKEEIITNLSKMEKSSFDVTNYIFSNFPSIETSLCELLIENISKYSRNVVNIVKIIEDYYDKFTIEYITKIIYNLMDHNNYRSNVAWLLVEHFSDIEENDRNAILDIVLSEKDALIPLSFIADSYFLQIPEKLRNEMLDYFVAHESSSYTIKSFISKYKTHIPDDILIILEEKNKSIF